MKTLQMIAICGLLLTGLFSCTKEKEAVYDPIDEMYETYTGKQGAGVEDPANYLQLKLEDHGSLLSFNSHKALPGSGSWEISGNRFRGSFRQGDNNMTVTLEGTYDPASHKISGSWGYGEFPIGGGSFYVVKEENKTAMAKHQQRAAGVLLHHFF